MVKGDEEQGSEILGHMSKLKGNFCSLEGQKFGFGASDVCNLCPS